MTGIKRQILIFILVVFCLTLGFMNLNIYYASRMMISDFQAPISSRASPRQLDSATRSTSQAGISSTNECTAYYIPVRTESINHSILSNASNDRWTSPEMTTSVPTQTCIHNFLSEYDQQCQHAITPVTKSSKTNANWMFIWLKSFHSNSMPLCPCVPDVFCKWTVYFLTIWNVLHFCVNVWFRFGMHSSPSYFITVTAG